MIINLDMGHSLTGAGTGAVGILSEVAVNREVGNKLINMLREKGHVVNNCTVDYADTTNEQLKGIVEKSNSHACDLFVSLHLNVGGGKGTETYVCPGASAATTNIATRVNKAVVESCGFTDRGVKEANFYVLKHTNAPAILVELFFIDSQGDVDKHNISKIAAGLFKGITGTEYTGNSISTPAPGDGETYFRVVCGSFKDRALADERAAEVKSKTGYDTFLVAYTK